MINQKLYKRFFTLFFIVPHSPLSNPKVNENRDAPSIEKTRVTTQKGKEFEKIKSTLLLNQFIIISPNAPPYPVANGQSLIGGIVDAAALHEATIIGKAIR